MKVLEQLSHQADGAGLRMQGDVAAVDLVPADSIAAWRRSGAI